MKHMVRSSRWTHGVVVVLFVVASPGIARASCFSPAIFGQLSANCGGSYCYVVSPGLHTAQTLAGSFWAFGNGNPAIGLGNDSGSSPVGDWLHDDDAGLWIGGNWQASPEIDGCVAGQVASGKPAEIMVALMSDENGVGGYFALAAARRVVNALTEFDFTFVAGGGLAHDIQLVDIPGARVASSHRDGAGVVLEFGSPTLEQASAGVSADDSVTTVELVKGYRIYSRSTSPQSHRTNQGWSAVTGIVPLGQNALVTMPPGSDVWYGYVLVFDGGFETAHVGRDIHSTSLPGCEVPPWDSDGDGFAFWPDPTCAPSADVIDCNDGNASVHPGALEICNGVDDNCNAVVDDVDLPGSVDSLQLDRLPDVTRLAWSPLGVATSYDVIRGDLTTLRNTGGSFAAATDSCLADEVAVSHIDDPEDPDPDYGFWYLLRAANCTGVGSYDGTDASQVAPRDAGVATSGDACP